MKNLEEACGVSGRGSRLEARLHLWTAKLDRIRMRSGSGKLLDLRPRDGLRGRSSRLGDSWTPRGLLKLCSETGEEEESVGDEVNPDAGKLGFASILAEI